MKIETSYIHLRKTHGDGGRLFTWSNLASNEGLAEQTNAQGKRKK
jgi:hypothetical protein